MKKPQLKPIIIGLGIFFVGMIITSIIWHNWDLGEVKAESYNVENFSKIDLSTIGYVSLKQGEKEGVYIKAPEKYLDKLEVKVRNSTLYIDEEGRSPFDCIGWLTWKRKDDVEIEITVKDLEKISASGSADLESGDTLSGENLEISVSGSSDIAIDLDYERLEYKVSGSGDIELTGNLKEQDIIISGSGDYDSKDIESENIEVEIEGSGDLSVWATNQLDIEIDGSGDIKYKGNPKVNKEVSGSGDIEHVD